jgi:hypothetical protein
MYQYRFKNRKLLYNFIALEIAVLNDSENSLPSKEKNEKKKKKLMKLLS